MKKIIYAIILSGLIIGCEKNDFELTENADEYFFLRNDGADMPVWVRGNTLSKTFVLVLHGGPGSGAIGSESEITSNITLTEKYAMVYWDQRSSGISQGHYRNEEINADQYVEDLEKLIVLIKNKYGNDISLFLYGGSWGGYLGFAYLVKDNNQENIKGWIDESGAHNFSLVGNAERRNLIKYANEFILKNINTDSWQEILDWCNTHDTIATSDNFVTINKYAIEATDLITDSIAPIDNDQQEILQLLLFGPLSSQQSSVNQVQIANSPLIKNILQLNLSSQLSKVTIPVLITGGKYDLIVPNEVIYEAYNCVGSEDKEIIIFNESGHAPSATQPGEFSTAIINFIEKFR
ncbi:MAG: alpha/beta hydrolase [Bacteroidales bacterium]|nr:alpha/beta hydrolase [Bacteroidales bacterium]MBN2817506.1 alpha/beta hydrolase [Bacteroidales bacterium]